MDVKSRSVTTDDLYNFLLFSLLYDIDVHLNRDEKCMISYESFTFFFSFFSSNGYLVKTKQNNFN